MAEQEEVADGERRDLVIVMAGDKSIHERLCEGRRFDLWVIYYGDDPKVAKRFRAGCDRYWARKGLKIELVRSICLEEALFKEAFQFEQYRYVFLPDDDIHFEHGAADVHQFFDNADRIGADYFQPAIANEHASFRQTQRLKGAFCHRVTWVENMMPALRSELFVSAFLGAVHALEYMRSGWGLEPVVVKLGEAHLRRGVRSFVIDASPVVHTRPVGQNSTVHQIGWDERLLLPQIDSNPLRTLRTYAAPEHAAAEELTPFARDTTAIQLAMQKVRFVRRLWQRMVG